MQEATKALLTISAFVPARDCNKTRCKGEVMKDPFEVKVETAARYSLTKVGTNPLKAFDTG